jgi:hypothetical protein
MNDFSRLTALYADDLSTQREHAARRSLRNSTPRRRTTRSTLASGLHRLANHLDGE